MLALELTKAYTYVDWRSLTGVAQVVVVPRFVKEWVPPSGKTVPDWLIKLLVNFNSPIRQIINDIGKDRIHGYVSASKYRQSELASMSGPADGAAQGANPNGQPAERKKLPLPQQ